MSHIRNYDIRLTTILASLVGAVVLLAELFGTHPPLLKRIKKLDAMAYRFRPAAPPTPPATIP